MTIHGTNERAGPPSALQARPPDARPRARWARSPNVLDRRTRQGVMVLPPEGAAVLLTGAAAQVWEALAQPLGRDQLADRLAHPAGAAGPGAGHARGQGAGLPADQVVAVLGDLRAIGAVREIR